MSRAEQTRRRLQKEAIRLFSQRGFDGVTVEEVAKAAGVSHMTFFRHFPTKESVVLDDPDDPVLGAAVAQQDTTLPALERVRRGVLQSWEGLDEPDDEMTRVRIRLADSHPSLRAGVWENNLRTEGVIVDALTETGIDRLEARVAAGAILGSLTAALFDWAEHEQAGSLGDRIRSALALLETGGARTGDGF
jgi:AcrR family transcriptional regulator